VETNNNETRSVIEKTEENRKGDANQEKKKPPPPNQGRKKAHDEGRGNAPRDREKGWKNETFSRQCLNHVSYSGAEGKRVLLKGPLGSFKKGARASKKK